MKQIVKINCLQAWGSYFSRKSWLIMVVKVLCKPAFKPFGGSLVTLMALCNKERGNKLCGSQVIQSLKSLCKTSVFSIKSKICAINSKPKWQFCNTTQDPDTKALSSSILANLSYPSPIDTFSAVFFFFLASSSIADYGSAPADNK